MNNLLSNAYKFTPEYGEISIQLSEGEENFLFIKISDTGIGISEENLPHIFDRFYQISSKLKTPVAESVCILPKSI